MTRRAHGRFGARRGPPRREVAEQHSELRAALGRMSEGLDIYRSHDRHLAPQQETRISELRRRSFRAEDDRLGTMTLVDEGGVLRWEPTSVVSSYATGRRLRRGPSPGTGTVVEQLRFEQLERSEVGDFLGRLDRKINDAVDGSSPGLVRSLTRALNLSQVATRPVPDGRILLLIHGTFSHSRNLHQALSATDEGKAFLAGARDRYQQVLFFDHPTLQVSPVINAVDLERSLRGSAASFDVVCHSRGGLVTRWWAENLLHDPERLGKVVFVGSPLAGTSLAAPPKLKRALDYFTNVFEALRKVSGMASQVQPMMVAVTGLLRVLSLATRAAARTPLVDVAVAAVPGLAGQSRVGDNPEIGRLRSGRVPLDRYFAVTSDFEPKQIGWKFWELFTRKPEQRLFDLGADLLFQGENDLVVDTRSMSDLKSDLKADIPAARVLEYEPKDEVHHLNYFEQKRTIDFLSETLLSA